MHTLKIHHAVQRSYVLDRLLERLFLEADIGYDDVFLAQYFLHSFVVHLIKCGVRRDVETRPIRISNMQGSTFNPGCLYSIQYGR